jgi:hypothetical protein
MIGEAVELIRLFRNLRLPPERLRRLQERRLRSLCRHARDNVPYYRRRFESAGIQPDDIRTLEDLRRLPITTKNDLRVAGLSEVVDRRADLASCVTLSTSGSIGEPFTAYLTPAEARTRALVQFRTLVTVGFRPWDRLIVFGPFRGLTTRLHQRLGLYRARTCAARSSGRVRSPLAVHPIVRGTVPNVARARLIQECVDHLLVQLVLDNDARPDLSELRRRYLEYLGEDVRIDVQVVDTIDADSSGSRPSVSKLS